MRYSKGQKEKLEAILNNPSFAGSVFLEELRSRLYAGQASADTATVVEEQQ